MKRLFVVALVLTVSSFGRGADGRFTFPLVNGDRVSAVFYAGADRHRFDVLCPSGAVMTLRATGTSLTMDVTGPFDEAISSTWLAPPAPPPPPCGGLCDLGKSGVPGANGKAVVRVTCGMSGVHHIDFSAGPFANDFTGYSEYGLSVSWRSQRVFARPRITLGADGAASITCSADAGAAVDCAVRRASRSTARPTLVAVDGPNGFTHAFGAGAVRGSLTAPTTGEYVFRFTDPAAPGATAAARVNVRPPKSSRRSLYFQNLGVEPGMDVFASKQVGAEGGVYSVDRGPLTGASFSIPEGMFTAPVTVFVGEADAVVPSDESRAAVGPAVVFGPLGVGSGSKSARFTIPFDPAKLSGAPHIWVSYGGSSNSYPVIYESVGADTVTFEATSFGGVFQVFGRTPATPATKFRPADAAALDLFGGSSTDEGRAVAIAGSTIAVGASEKDERGRRSGSMRVFTTTGGDVTETAKIVPDDGVAGDGFGYAVALSKTGDTLVVGTAKAEAAYVYALIDGAWTLQARLVSPETEFVDSFGDGFGHAVAIDGDTLVVGAERHASDATARRGAAWVFARAAGAWSVQGRLDANYLGDGRLGRSVAVDGDSVVCGAPLAFVGGTQVGEAFVFARSGATWSLERTLRSPYGAPGEQFGESVALDRDTALVGAPFSPGYGYAHVFRRGVGQWKREAWLAPSQTTYQASFGASVTLSGDLAVVSTPHAASGAGAAYVYRRSGLRWTQIKRLDPPSPADGDLFGFAVALSGTNAVLVAPRDDEAGRDAGAAYFIDLSGL